MKNLWDQAKSLVKERVDEKDFLCWIEPVTYAGTEGQSIRLMTQNNFFRRWFIENYLDQIKDVIESMAKHQVNIVVDVVDQDRSKQDVRQMNLGLPQKLSENKPSTHKTVGRPSKLPKPIFNPRYTFAKFIEGPNNQLARAASLSVAAKPGKSFNPLFLYGGTGLGKTHLLNAIGNRILTKCPEMKVVSLSSEKFMNEMINAIYHNRVNGFRNKYRNCDCLLIDDIQFLSGKERTQEEFFHTFNSLHEAGSQIVLTSDRVPKDIPDIEDRLRTRFGWGLVADIQPPELETRLAILVDLTKREDVPLPDDVAFFLASKFDNNVRDLEGAFIRLTAYNSFNDGEISMEMAQKVLGHMIQDNRRGVITVDMVQKSVCDYFRIKLSDIKSARRQRIVAVPRQIGMYLSRKLTRSSFPEIGQQFGGRDHSTVIHACNKIDKLTEMDPELVQTLDTLEKTLRS